MAKSKNQAPAPPKEQPPTGVVARSVKDLPGYAAHAERMEVKKIRQERPFANRTYDSLNDAEKEELLAHAAVSLGLCKPSKG